MIVIGCLAALGIAAVIIIYAAMKVGGRNDGNT